jgi:hypothetical protein
VIEAFFELLVQSVVEILAEVIFELFVTLGWESLTDSISPERPFS